MLEMTDAAVAYAKQAAEASGRAPVVRVRAVGGGCSGLTWQIELGAEAATDLRRTTSGVLVVVDPVSAEHFRGATLDFGSYPPNGLHLPLVEGPVPMGLVLRDLPGKHVCGCGESWAP